MSTLRRASSRAMAVVGKVSHGMKKTQDLAIFSKTELCKFYAKGKCSRGSTCAFAHAESQLQPKPDLGFTKLCSHYARYGSCVRGVDCMFAHGAEELRANSRESTEHSPVPGDLGPMFALTLQATHVLVDMMITGMEQRLVRGRSLCSDANMLLAERSNCADRIVVPNNYGFSQQSSTQFTSDGRSAFGNENKLSGGKFETFDGDNIMQDSSQTLNETKDPGADSFGSTNYGSEASELVSFLHVGDVSSRVNSLVVVRNTFIEIKVIQSTPLAPIRRSQSLPSRISMGGNSASVPFQ